MKALQTFLAAVLLLASNGLSVPAWAKARDLLLAFKPAETKVGQTDVVIPARRLADMLLVEASIDGHGPFLFILDTGAGAVFVSPELAANLANKKKKAQVYLKEKDGDRQIGREVAIDRLTLGEAEFKNFRALMVDLADLQAATGERIDGLLGFSLFANCLLTLDFPRGRVVLRKGQLPKPTGDDIFPYSLEPGGTPQVTLLVGDSSFPAVIDSGQTDALAVPALKHLAFAKGPIEGPLMASIGGRQRRQVGRLAGVVRLGRYTFDSPVALEDGPTGRVGASILRFFAVTFDPVFRTVRFAREGESALVANSPRTVGLGFSRSKGGWKVVDILPNTPASSAGIQVGDVLLTINGRPVSEVDYNLWQSLLQSESSLSVELLRGENRTQIILPVGELVR